MCGTPLPHRPLTAPGTRGTHTFTRAPLESAKPEREPAGNPAEEMNAPAEPIRSGAVIKVPGGDRPQAQNSAPSSAEMVPEIPLDEYVKSFRYIPPTDPNEITMRGDVEVLRPEFPADVPPVLTETITAAERNPISATEDVGERLGLDEPPPDDEPRDRPRFLDFREPALPLEKPEALAIEGPSFLGLSAAPRVPAPATGEIDAGKPPRDSGWSWVAVVALLGFVSLGVLEWRSQANQTSDGLVEVVKMKLANIWRGHSPAPQAPSSAETNAAKPNTQVEEQPKPQPQGQDVPANPNVASGAIANKPPGSDASSRATANSQQNTLTATETQLPAGQKIASPSPGSSPTGSLPTTTQKAAQSKPTPPTNTAKFGTATEAPAVVSNTVAKPKPKAAAAQEGDPDTPVKKPVPGEEELAKADGASDAAAAAAWLWKATEKGNPEAPLRLAEMYIKGDDVPRSCEQALGLLRMAADKGSVQARNRMASMYSIGTCVQRNVVKAYRWLSSALAADPNNLWAQQNRDLIWQQMTPEERAAVLQRR